MIYAAGLILRAPDGRILLLERSSTGDHAGEWAFPGGKIEDSETEAEAVERECREELGPISYDNPRKVAHSRDDRVDYTTFLANTSQAFEPQLNEEHTGYTWVSPASPPNPMHPGARKTLDGVLSMLEAMPVNKNIRSHINLDLEQAFCISIPAIVKSHIAKSGQRIVEVEASCEEVDSEGDVILQQALLDSAADFIATGCLDLDHKSEIGYQLGIPDPASYIVGRPLEVKALPGRRTSVVGEIRRSPDGRHDPQRYKYDDLWESLQSNPPVPWYASIFGFPKPGMIENCASGTCEAGARRYLIRGLMWRSLAFTRNPVNQSLRGQARIITAKSMLAQMAKSMSILESQGVNDEPSHTVPPTVSPRVGDLWAGRDCKACSIGAAPTLSGWREHFTKCASMTPDMADLCSYAMMHKCNMEKAMASFSA